MFSPLYIFTSFVKDKVPIGAWIYLWAFYPVPLIYISVSVMQSEVSQKEKNKYCILTHICGIWKNGTDEPIRKAEIYTQM